MDYGFGTMTATTYKMYSNISLIYLSFLYHFLQANFFSYNLKPANNLQSIKTRTSEYYNCFLPSRIREWNSLSEETKRKFSQCLQITP